MTRFAVWLTVLTGAVGLVVATVWTVGAITLGAVT